MKILYLIDNFSIGGAQTVVKGLMEKNAKNREIYAIALRQKFPENTIDHPNAICFQSKSKYSLRPLKFLERIISEKQIEIIHCQLPRSIFFGYLLKRTSPYIKYIIHEQGDVFESRIYSLFLRILKRKADGIIACSEATKKELSTRLHLAPQKTSVLYNFVDLARFSPGKDSAGNRYKIAFAGRIEKRKGWREFVKAAKHFHSIKKLSFYIAGSGTEEGKLIRIIQNQEYSNIRFVGFKANIEEFYKAIDLLVIPSHFEPMGMVAVEAMACGVPVLAANVPGLNEVVKHEINGWTYSSKSVTELTNAIEKIINCNPEKVKTIIDKGIEHSREFSFEIFSNKLLKFYSALF
ncbi:D-inositol-3-phosphate glycosyltransferase [subsurface metagenome]